MRDLVWLSPLLSKLGSPLREPAQADSHRPRIDYENPRTIDGLRSLTGHVVRSAQPSGESHADYPVVPLKLLPESLFEGYQAGCARLWQCLAVAKPVIELLRGQ